MESRFLKYWGLTMLILMLAIKTTWGQSSSASIVIIGNNTGEQTLSDKELVQIFRGQKNYWKTNESILLVLPSDKHKEAEIVSEYLYDMNIGEMQKYWLALVFQGRAKPPVFERSNEDIFQLVKSTPGAIGILVNFQGSIPEELLINIQ